MAILGTIEQVLQNPWAQNVVGGILSGFAVLLFIWLWSVGRRKCSRAKFKRIFGPNVDAGYTLVCGALELADKSRTHPYVKPAGNPGCFSITLPVSICEVRAGSYLAGTIGKIMGYAPRICSDLEVHAKLDLDFVALGGPASNLKTADCQTNSSNRLVIFDQTKFIRKSNGENLGSLDPGFDYGMILKVRPEQFPNRVWFSCAGLGEWGTSGAAWFLANKWDALEKSAGAKEFAAVVRVRPGQDESAQVVEILV